MESHPTSINGLGKLLPKAITSRRRKKHSRDVDPDLRPDDDRVQDSYFPSQSGSHSQSDDTLSAPSIAHTTTTITSAGNSNRNRNRGRARSRSRHNSNMADPEETSSLIAYDSDLDVSSHPHIISSARLSQGVGYLAQDAHLKGGPPSSIPRSATFHTAAAESDITAPQPTLSSFKTGLLPLQSSSASKRSASPAGRFREVFRSKKTSSASSSPERRFEQLPESDNRPAIPISYQLSEAINRPQTAPVPAPRLQSKPSQTKIDTSALPPRTPPTSDYPSPLIVNTPPTPTDPVHPHTQHSPTRDSLTSAPDGGSSPVSSNVTSPGKSVSTTRRLRSGSNASIGPSKLSNITLPPLTPTPENGPGGPYNTAGSSFFSSMISAAQNAANTLSNTITTTNIGPAKGRPDTASKDRARDITESIENLDEEGRSQPDMLSQSSDQKELAVNTLGHGSLSLSQLGLAEATSNATTPVALRFPDSTDSQHRVDSAPVDPGLAHGHESPGEDNLALPRPISLYDSSGPGDRTPPTASVYEGKSGLQRTGSIRSVIGSTRHRARGGSAATGNTIGAAISAATASIGHAPGNASVPKLTGFAVASKKRNRDFHNFFKSVPDDDYLIEDYSCAIQREILAHGRLYVSEGHLCFSSNIFGWVTTLVMGFDEIVSVEKRSTALVFKNGLMISTLHAKHVFASFTSRDSTYDLIVNIWKLGHPSLRSSLNGVRIDETGGDKTEKVDVEPIAKSGNQSGSESEEDDSEDGEDIYDEDEDDAESPDTTQAPYPASVNGDAEKTTSSRKVSGPALSTSGGVDKSSKEATVTSPATADFPGPSSHPATDCGDSDTHLDRSMGDDIIPAPLGKVFNMMFGPPTWIMKFITNDQKCTDLQMDDKAALSAESKTRDYTFIKPLNGPIGPKQTKCIVSECLDTLDFNKAANITVTTQTPDVPSGNIFTVKTRYCLCWAENNQTRIQITCSVEWSSKSWLRAPIEKGTFDGQTQYAKELFVALKSAVASRSRAGTLTNGGAVKAGKRKGRKGRQAQPTSTAVAVDTLANNAKQSWGVLEPIQPFLGPVVDIVKPIFTGNVVYGLLVGLLVATWFGVGFPDRPTGGVGRPPYGGHDPDYRYYPDRIAAYEEMWRREESELWDWLKERVGLDRLGNEGEPLGMRKRAVEPRTMEERLREDRMDQREMDEAIRVTEERLKILKEVVESRKVMMRGDKSEE